MTESLEASSPGGEPGAKKGRGKLRTVLFVVALVVLGAVLWEAWDHQAFLAWKQGAGPVRFFAVMAILPALGMPTTPLFLLAGATFGRTLGFTGSMIAYAANLALCYWIAGSGLRPQLLKFLQRYKYELPDFTLKKGGLRFTVILKLTPGLPASAKNYLLGISAVPFVTYFVVGMVLTGAYGALLVLLGESLFEHDLRQAWWAVVALAAAGLLVWWLRGRERSVEQAA